MRLIKINVDNYSDEEMTELIQDNFYMFDEMPLHQQQRILAEYRKSPKYSGDDPSFYSESEVVQMLSEDGFKIVK